VYKFLGILLFIFVRSTSALSQIDLPTDPSHYESYDPEASAQKLLLQLAVQVPEASRARAMDLFQRAKAGNAETLTVAELRKLLEDADWTTFRPDVLRLLLHGSRVLDVVPKDAQDWLPLVHDSLLFFLDRLSGDRLLARIVGQANLPQDASRGDRAVAFIVDTPSLQKLAQIFARNPSIDPDIRVALQTVENGVSSARYEDVRAQLEREMDESLRNEYSLAFADHLMAEASVGAVMEVTFAEPGSSKRRRAACKVLKPAAVAALKEDLEIIDDLLVYLEEHADAYNIGSTPLVDIFTEVREALSREVRVEDERKNLQRAGEYYRDNPKILVPALYPFSTPNVTCMEFVEGEKITDAFVGRPQKRAVLARRLSDVLTYGVLFSPHDEALFHGDPHAGNVFHVEGDEDPYRIALLDWGLAAEFDRSRREKMIQVMLGLQLRHAKRLANNVDALVDWEPRDEADRLAMRARMEDVLASEHDEGLFALIDELIVSLAAEGYSVRFDTTMFIKSQLTISGILAELDPDFDQDDYIMGRVSGQVFHELGTRLVRTIWFPAWNSHDYTSLMSNEDVKDVQFQKIGRGFKKVGKGIWKGITFQWLF